MLIFREFFKTQSDHNIRQNAPNCITFSKFPNPPPPPAKSWGRPCEVTHTKTTHS